MMVILSEKELFKSQFIRGFINILKRNLSSLKVWQFFSVFCRDILHTTNFFCNSIQQSKREEKLLTDKGNDGGIFVCHIKFSKNKFPAS